MSGFARSRSFDAKLSAPERGRGLTTEQSRTHRAWGHRPIAATALAWAAAPTSFLKSRFWRSAKPRGPMPRTSSSLGKFQPLSAAQMRDRPHQHRETLASRGLAPRNRDVLASSACLILVSPGGTDNTCCRVKSALPCLCNQSICRSSRKTCIAASAPICECLTAYDESRARGVVTSGL